MRADLNDELLAAIAAASHSWRSADEAVTSIAEKLPADLDLSRVGIRTHLAETQDVILIAVWTPTGTLLAAGLRHPSSGTMWETYESVLRLRRAQIRRIGDEDLFLYEKMLLEEGSRAAIQIPLLEQGVARAIMNIMSSRDDAFSDGELLFYERLGEVVAGTLLGFVDATLAR
jgi:hypothetical protein